MVPRGEFDSLDPDPETVRELGYRAVDMMADHFAEIREVATLPDATPPDVASEFDDPLPREGADPETVLAEWKTVSTSMRPTRARLDGTDT